MPKENSKQVSKYVTNKKHEWYDLVRYLRGFFGNWLRSLNRFQPRGPRTTPGLLFLEHHCNPPEFQPAPAFEDELSDLLRRLQFYTYNKIGNDSKLACIWPAKLLRLKCYTCIDLAMDAHRSVTYFARRSSETGLPTEIRQTSHLRAAVPSWIFNHWHCIPHPSLYVRLLGNLQRCWWKKNLAERVLDNPAYDYQGRSVSDHKWTHSGKLHCFSQSGQRNEEELGLQTSPIQGQTFHVDLDCVTSASMHWFWLHTGTLGSRKLFPRRQCCWYRILKTRGVDRHLHLCRIVPRLFLSVLFIRGPTRIECQRRVIAKKWFW